MNGETRLVDTVDNDALLGDGLFDGKTNRVINYNNLEKGTARQTRDHPNEPFLHHIFLVNQT